MAKQLYPQDRAIRIQAAALSVLMHVFLFLAMIFMIDWKAVHINPAVMQATLWDSLPSKSVAKSEILPPKPLEPVEPTPEPPLPEKVTPPEVEANEMEQQAEIVLKKREQEKQRLEEERKKQQEQKLKKLQEDLRKQEEQDKLKKVQEALRQQDIDAQQAAAAATVDPSVLSYYMGLMSRKIRTNVNSGLCPVTNPELLVDIQLTNTGDISGTPKLVRGSGDAVCDDAVIRAILAAKPFDLPDDTAARKKMVDQIRLKFRPRG